MKAILIFGLCFALASSTLTGNWEYYNTSNARNDPTIQRLLDFGIEEFVPQAIDERQIKGSEWAVKKILTIETQVTDGLNYRFAATLKNPQEATANVTLVINWQPWADRTTLLSWNVDDLSQELKDQSGAIDVEDAALKLKQASQDFQKENPNSSIGLLMLSLGALTQQITGNIPQRRSFSSMMLEANANIPSTNIGNWNLEETTLQDEVIGNLSVALFGINQKEQTLELKQMTIADVYMHFTKVLGGTSHKITFRSANAFHGGDNKIIQVTYTYKPWLAGDAKTEIQSYAILDDKATYEPITDLELLQSLMRAVEYYLKTIKPNVVSHVNPPLLGAYVTERRGEKFYYLSTLVQGTDNSVERFEFWLNKPTEKEVHSFRDYNLFTYQRLALNKETMTKKGDLANIFNENGQAVCSNISSFFVCSVLPECVNKDFVEAGVCQSA